MQQMQANQSVENAKQWRQQVPLHKTHTNKQKKQNKAKQSRKLQEIFFLFGKP